MCHGSVTCDVTGGVTVPRPDPTRPTVITVACTSSGYASIDLTVGVDAQSQEAWMLEDLDLLDDDKIHRCCLACYPFETWRAFDTYLSMCGRRVLSTSDAQGEAVPDPCAACDRAAQCPICGAV